MPMPPLDLVEYEGRPPFADFKPVCMDTYTKLHRKRWGFRTRIGDVVLKKLGQLERDRLSIEFFDGRPELVKVFEEAIRLREFQRKGIPLDEAHTAKLEDCGRLLRDQQRLFSMTCFVTYVLDEKGEYVLDEYGRPEERPQFASLEEYDAFLSALEPDEVNKLYTYLNELTSTRSATASCEVLLSIAKDFGIPISKDLTLENMTAEQADILITTVEKRGEAIKREMDKIAE